MSQHFRSEYGLTVKQWQALLGYVQKAMNIQSNRRHWLEERLEEYQKVQKTTHTYQQSGIGPTSVIRYMSDNPVTFEVGHQHFRVWVTGRGKLKVNCSTACRIHPEASNAVYFECDQ